MKRSMLLPLCALALAACDAAPGAGPTGPGMPPESLPVLVGPAAPRDAEAADALARAFAGALADAGVRRTVHQAWRNSPMTAHKLVLQDFVRTPEGQRLVEAAARAAGSTPEEIRALMARLPAMDFYVPLREDRRTWKGTADAAVFATVHEDDAEVEGYTTRGKRLVLRSGARLGRPVVLLHPAEPKGRRVDPQPLGPGEVIQDATDGERSGSVSYRGPDGEWVTVDLADLAARQRSTAKGSSSGGLVSPGGPSLNLVAGSTTYLVQFDPDFVDGVGYQDCEIRYRLLYYQNGTYVTEQRYIDYGVPCSAGKDYRTSAEPYGYALASFEPVEGSVDQIRLHIKELDEWSDDDYGSTMWGYQAHVNGWWGGPTRVCGDNGPACYEPWAAVLQW